MREETGCVTAAPVAAANGGYGFRQILESRRDFADSGVASRGWFQESGNSRTPNRTLDRAKESWPDLQTCRSTLGFTDLQS
jgi:hypothetical protein